MKGLEQLPPLPRAWKAALAIVRDGGSATRKPPTKALGSLIHRQLASPFDHNGPPTWLACSFQAATTAWPRNKGTNTKSHKAHRNAMADCRISGAMEGSGEPNCHD